MHTARLFEIVYMLAQNRGTTAGMLAEKFEVSTRTIYRDIDTLCEAGIPIYTEKGKGGGIRLMEGYVLNKAVMTREEKKMLISGLQAVASVRPDENSDVLSRLENMLGSSENWLEIDFGNWRNSGHEEAYFSRIKEAVLQKECITFSYTGQRGVQEQREAEPLRLVFRSMAWYLYAFCRKRQGFRFFKLSRMQQLTGTGEHFERKQEEPVLTNRAVEPGKDIEQGRDVEQGRDIEPGRDIEQGRDIEPGRDIAQGKVVRIRLLVEAASAYRAYDEFVTYETLDNGDVLAELEISESNGLYGYLLSFGDHVQVLEPAFVRDKLAAFAARIYLKNGGKTDKTRVEHPENAE